jgi:hypothetical protein
MARLKLSASGLRSPLDLSVVPAPADVAPADEAAPRAARLTSAPTIAPEPAVVDAARAPAATAVVDAPPSGHEATAIPPAPEAGPATETTPTTDAAASALREATDAPADAASDQASPTTETAAVETPSTVEAPAVAATPSTVEAPAVAATPATVEAPAVAPTPAADLAGSASLDASDVPAWAQGLAHAALAPDRLLGRPKQTALILDRELSSRADALVAATGPRVTFAALVTAILHFHLPADGEAAARAIGGYRRRKLETLDRPWEERNARLPEPLRAELDDVVAGATGRVASVRRSTLVNALLDAHLPDDADGAARLVVRMEMVRGGAFLDLVA